MGSRLKTILKATTALCLLSAPLFAMEGREEHKEESRHLVAVSKRVHSEDSSSQSLRVDSSATVQPSLQLDVTQQLGQNNKHPLGPLPHRLVVHSQSFLNLTDLFACASVSKGFHAASLDYYRVLAERMAITDYSREFIIDRVMLKRLVAFKYPRARLAVATHLFNRGATEEVARAHNRTAKAYFLNLVSVTTLVDFNNDPSLKAIFFMVENEVWNGDGDVDKELRTHSERLLKTVEEHLSVSDPSKEKDGELRGKALLSRRQFLLYSQGEVSFVGSVLFGNILMNPRTVERFKQSQGASDLMKKRVNFYAAVDGSYQELFRSSLAKGNSEDDSVAVAAWDTAREIWRDERIPIKDRRHAAFTLARIRSNEVWSKSIKEKSISDEDLCVDLEKIKKNASSQADREKASLFIDRIKDLKAMEIIEREYNVLKNKLRENESRLASILFCR